MPRHCVYFGGAVVRHPILAFIPYPAWSRRNSPKKEKWSKNNVFTNNVEAPSYMVNLPENGVLKEGIFEGLRPILEEWSGVRWHEMGDTVVEVGLSVKPGTGIVCAALRISAPGSVSRIHVSVHCCRFRLAR